MYRNVGQCNVLLKFSEQADKHNGKSGLCIVLVSQQQGKPSSRLEEARVLFLLEEKAKESDET